MPLFSRFRSTGRQSLVRLVKLTCLPDSASSMPRGQCCASGCPSEMIVKRSLHVSSSKPELFGNKHRNGLFRRPLNPTGKHCMLSRILPLPEASFSSSPLLFEKSPTLRDRLNNMRGKLSYYVFKDKQKGLFQKFEQPKTIDDSNSVLKMRYVYLTTCVGQWEDVPVGVKFDVAYADSHPEDPYSLNTPVIVGLHGAPGSHHHLLPILEPMVTKGYRVIIPNFPGFGYTRGIGPGHEDCFTHAPEEKVSFLADFLTVIGIPRVDLLVGHSAGCYPLLELCAEFKGVQSAMLICPGLHTPYRGIQPERLLKSINRYWDKPMLHPFLKAFVSLGTKNRFKDTLASDIITAIRTLVNVDYDCVVTNVVHVVQKKVPLCVVFSDNDKNLELDLMKQFLSLMGISEDKITKVSTDTHDNSTGVTDYPKAVMLEGGTHNPMKKYQNVILSEQQKLLSALGKGR